jgi:hypothetical protein
MKSPLLAVSKLLIASTLATPHTFAQTPRVENAVLDPASAPLHAERLASSGAFVTARPRAIGATRSYRPFSSLGMATRVGLSGAGFDLATPLARKFNLRAGMLLLATVHRDSPLSVYSFTLTPASIQTC